MLNVTGDWPWLVKAEQFGPKLQSFDQKLEDSEEAAGRYMPQSAKLGSCNTATSASRPTESVLAHAQCTSESPFFGARGRL